MVGDVAVRNSPYVRCMLVASFIAEFSTVLPYRRHIPSIADLAIEEKTAFADILSKMTKRYDNLFQCSFAYSMGIHQRPVPIKEGDKDEHEVAHLHLHFSPPLLRSSTVKKFLVGYVRQYSRSTPH